MVLIVDDDADNLRIMQTILRSAGFEVMVERNGKQAVARAEDCPRN